MEGSTAVGIVAVAAAFCAALFGAQAAMGRFGADRPGPLPGDGLRNGRAAWLLRNGIAALLPVSRALCRSRRVQRVLAAAGAELGARGYRTAPEQLGTVALAALALVAVASMLASGSPVCGAAVAACSAAVAGAWAHAAEDRRRERMREAVPDALQSMGVCFQTGLSLVQTLEQAGSEAKGPLQPLFAQASHRLQMGGSTSDALASLAKDDAVPELAFVAVALDVQHQTGGSMRQVLDAVRDTVESELELARSLRVQTAQAKLSARVVSAMPFVLIALFSLVSEDFLSPFFSSAAGIALLAVAFSMQAAGVLAVRRMLKVEG